jgi:hypothetical protein
MSNPGPAVTTSIHPQNLATNQALRLIATAQGVNLNVTGDTQVNVIDVTNYVPVSVITANCNNSGSAVSSISSVYLGVYTAPAQGGTAVLTAAALSSNSTTANAKVVAATLNASATNAQQLYVNVATATATGTIDVYVYGYDLSSF